MIATKMLHNGENKIVLVFHDGSHAIHHGLDMWTIRYPDSDFVDSFVPYQDEPDNDTKKGILGYTANYSNKMGFIY